LVSFNHVTDPHFVTFSSNLYIGLQQSATLTLTLTRTLIQSLMNIFISPKMVVQYIHDNPNPNSKPNPNHNPTVITDRQIGPRDPQIVTVQIRPAPHFVASHFHLQKLRPDISPHGRRKRRICRGSDTPTIYVGGY